MHCADPERVRQLCQECDPAAGIAALAARLQFRWPELDFRHALTRGHWHRLGGVVNAQHQRVSDNLTQWSKTESGGEVDNLLVKYADAGYFVTKLSGRTHYLTAPIGDQAAQFLQLEIEELQEVLERPLIELDSLPDSLEEFIDPLDFQRLEPQPVAPPYYQFRRLTEISKISHDAGTGLRRFLDDWNRSSAHKAGHFCRHWVLELREYTDQDGEYQLSAKPVMAYAPNLPDIPAAAALHGAQLANALRAYDHQLGYPFAWYFILLTRKAANYPLAEAVLRDQAGEYDYLPTSDLHVLQAWAHRPYAV